MNSLQRTVKEACARFRLSRNTARVAGMSGTLLGRGEGNSVEFQDFRRYVPGDDPRHVDWAVYARTGELNLRLFREEIEPHVEVLLDGSRSMQIDDGDKGLLSRAIPAFMSESARILGCSTRIQLVGEELQRIRDPSTLHFDSSESLLATAPHLVTRTLRRGSLVVVCSDFLSGKAPQPLLRALSEGASKLMVVMLLGPWEAAPSLGPMHRLVDVETGQELSTQLSGDVVRRYEARLRRLQKDLRDGCRRIGADFASVVCDRPLLRVLAEDLLPSRMVLPV